MFIGGSTPEPTANWAGRGLQLVLLLQLPLSVWCDNSLGVTHLPSTSLNSR